MIIYCSIEILEKKVFLIMIFKLFIKVYIIYKSFVVINVFYDVVFYRGNFLRCFIVIYSFYYLFFENNFFFFKIKVFYYK